MCGITGYFDIQQGFQPAKFARANNIIRHRGPDDYGYTCLDNEWSASSFYDENLNDFHGNTPMGALGFRRLSIIDLTSKGHQPMCSQSGKLWIVFNGEVYNYIEIREELKAKGYVFNSATDTEVILYAYQEWGEKCLERFNGMWAFCIVDTQKRKLFCARDRMGIKPFYFFADKYKFIFASEMKQILELMPETTKGINDRLIFDFLALGSYGNETHETYFKNIVKLNPGSFLEVQFGKGESIGINEKKWWSLPVQTIELPPEEELYERLYEILLDSVKLRLRSDVPQGTALSGGLDSSVLVKMVDILRGGKSDENKVFTITSDNADINDKYYADILTKNLPVTSFQKNFESVVNLDDLQKVLWHQEEPIQTASIFGSWELYKFFREQNVTVNLDGQGADELLYGYHNFPFRSYLVSSVRDFGLRETQKQMKEIASLYGVSYYSLNFQLAKGLLVKRFRAHAAMYHYFKLKKEKSWLNDGFYKKQYNASYLINNSYMAEGLQFSSELKRKSYDLIRHTNLPGILRQVDRNSMAFSVESRLPFLDYRFVELCFSLPSHFMFQNGFTKYPLRKAMIGKLPEEVLWRRNKVGFNMPEYEILSRNKLFVKDVLSSLQKDERINYASLEKELDFYLSSNKNYNNIAWRFFIYALWKKEFDII